MKNILIATAALMAGTAALAQGVPVAPPVQPAPMAHPMADRIMTRNEVVAKVREHFGRMDVDKDGAISTAEASAGMNHRGGAWQGQNARGMGRHDGKMHDPNAAFDRLDVNRDGSINRDEFAKARERRIERRVAMHQEGKDGAARRGRGMHRMGGMAGGRMIVMADTNHDGKITLAEAQTLALQHFDHMDTNRDGQVTPEERRAGHPMMIKRMMEQKKPAG